MSGIPNAQPRPESALIDVALRAFDDVATGLVAATVAIEPFEPLALFAAALDAGLEPTLWLQPTGGLALVGIGRAWQIEPAGEDRFSAVSQAWSELLSSARTSRPQPREGADGIDGAAPPAPTGPILMGSLGFTGRASTDRRWRAFGAASLVLPELLATHSRSGSWLTASLVRRPSLNGHKAAPAPAELERRWAEVTTRAAALETAAGLETAKVPPNPPNHLSVAAEQPDRRTWDRLVGQFAGAVGRGRLDKVVLARRVDLEARSAIDPVAALRRLAAGAAESTIYAVSRGSRVFLGATPERLARSEGREFETLALAGSIRRGADAEEDAVLAAQLLSSEKDLEEHAVVVRMIRDALTRVADDVRIPAAPRVVRLRTIQHLATPIAGRVREREGILGLAARLHPTPAVGGVPRDLALQLIAEHEGFERGWYAGPLGWLGADGDGELVVALRCALVEGREASLFAGCGIVADSDPTSEWEESWLKLRAVASALGELEP